jgi:hypothetical protein
MANELKSEDIVLEANIGTVETPDWVKLVCLTEKSFSSTANSIDIITDCGGDFTTPKPGKISWTFSGSGYANMDPDSNEGSHELLLELHKARTVTGFRETTSDGSYYREGIGWLDSVEETSSSGDYLQFSFSVTGSGEYYVTPQS